MNKFRLGIITGMSSIIIAVPVISQVAGAQSSTASTRTTASSHVAPTQACVLAMTTVDELRLKNFDTEMAAHKQQLQTRVSTLKSAAALTDDAAREDALKQMREDMQKSHDTMKDSVNPEIKTAMDAVRKACGDSFMQDHGQKKGPRMMGSMKKDPAFMANKLNMTADELKAALDSGKTIKDLATEKGIDLPDFPRGGRHMMNMR